MTLIQKLPIGLALAACVMMSSCSEEDVAQPEKSRMENGFSNERGGSGLQAVATIPTTDGPAGINIFAPGWEKIVTSYPDDPQINQAGTSTKNYLWGDPNLVWTKPLLNAPGANNNNTNNFVTIFTQKDVIGNFENVSEARTKIKNLTVGKKYAVTISVASTIYVRNGQPTQYLNNAEIEIPGMISGWQNKKQYDLHTKKAEWVTHTIIFAAQSSEVPVTFRTNVVWNGTPPWKHLAYAHAFVDTDAIVEVP